MHCKSMQKNMGGILIMKNDLFNLYLSEGLNAIPYPLLDSIFKEIYNMPFSEWQKRNDLDYPDTQIKNILSSRYRDFEIVCK